MYPPSCFVPYFLHIDLFPSHKTFTFALIILKVKLCQPQFYNCIPTQTVADENITSICIKIIPRPALHDLFYCDVYSVNAIPLEVY